MKYALAFSAFITLSACTGDGLTIEPMAVNPIVPPVVMTAFGCAVTGACVMP